MAVALIAAMSLNRVIGRDAGLPWRLPDDMKHFRRTTMGCPVIMGRATFDADTGVLPGRLNIIVTRNRSFRADGAEVAHSLRGAIDIANANEPDRDAFVIGGGTIYREAIRDADRIELTTVHAVIEGDTTFPEIDPERWQLASARHQVADDRHAHGMTFQTLVRRG
ncbi:MAG: dihydrofolate reductase [Planctomycetota bacterium]